MAHLLNIESSPRGRRSASISVAEAFLAAYHATHEDATLDTLNVWEEDLPEFDAEAIGAKYKGAAGEPMEGAEAALWQRVQTLAGRFQKADRIVLGVPMWNFAYPYKLKQLIDLACQRNLLFRFDGQSFGPMLQTEKALVIYSRGQSYGAGSATPAAEYDYQSGYIEWWLRFIGVRAVQTLVVDNTWTPQEAAQVRKAEEQARAMAAGF